MPNDVIAQSPNYHKDIAPLIERSCMPCHEKNNVGAMPLTTYEEVRSYGQMIVYVTREQIMPPWKARENYPPHRNARILTSKEIKTIQDWLEGGFLEGDCSPSNDEKVKIDSISNDTIICMKKSFPIRDDYKEHSQVFVFDNPYDSTVYISDIDFLPGASHLVKNCTVSIDTSSRSVELDRNDPKYGYTNYGGVGFSPKFYAWYDWMVGDAPLKLHPPQVKELPLGSKIMMKLQYLPTHVSVKDSSCLVLKLAKPSNPTVIRSEIVIDTSHLIQKPFLINPEEYRRFHAIRKLDSDIDLYGLKPHGMFVCISWKLYAELPNGSKIDLLDIPEWDPMWQRKYEYVSPVHLPAETIIHAIATYDNTEENLSIPVFPPTYIRYGESRKKELFLVQYDYTKTENP